MNILVLFIFTVLIILMIQDFKFRKVHIGFLFLLLLLTMTQWYLKSNNIKILLFNSIFLTSTLVLLKGYTIVMKKEKTADIIYGIGLGDILFFYAILPLFGTINYMLYFIVGMLFSLILALIVSLVKKETLIPLVSYFSIFTILCYLLIYFLQISTYNDLFITKLAN